MKIGSFDIAGRATHGAVTTGSIVDIGKRLQARGRDLASHVASEQGMAEPTARAAAEAANAGLEAVRQLPVFPRAVKTFCFGISQESHLENGRIRKSAHRATFLLY